MLKTLKSPNFPYVIGHRGARSYAPENTLAGFKKGLSCGAHLIECDVHLTLDNHVVIIHDDTVNRTTRARKNSGSDSQKPIRGYIHKLTLKELRSLDAGDGEKIPTLDEALKWVQKSPALTGFVIEIKTCEKDSRDLAQPVVDVILARKMAEKCMVISFDHPTVGRVKKLCPALAVGLLYSQPEELDKDIFALCKKYKADMIWPSLKAVTPELVTLAHKKGLGVFTWVANTEKDIQKAITAGVDGIGSDVPDRIKK